MCTAQRLARAGALALLLAAACSRGTGGSSGGNSGSDIATLDDVRALCAASCDESGRCTGTPGTDCGCRAKVEPFVDVLSRSVLATARDCLAQCIDEDTCDTRVYDSDPAVRAAVESCKSYFSSCPFETDISLCLILAYFRPEPRDAIVSCFPEPCMDQTSINSCFEQAMGL